MNEEIRDLNKRINKIEDEYHQMNEKYTITMSEIETKLHLLNTSSMIEFKAITTEVLSSIGEDMDKIEKSIKDLKDDFITFKSIDLQKIKDSVLTLKVKMFIYTAIAVFLIDQIFSLIFYFVKLKL